MVAVKTVSGLIADHQCTDSAHTHFHSQDHRHQGMSMGRRGCTTVQWQWTDSTVRAQESTTEAARWRTRPVADTSEVAGQRAGKANPGVRRQDLSQREV